VQRIPFARGKDFVSAYRSPWEAVERFREAVAVIAAEVGIDEPPELLPAHSFFSS